MPRKKPNKMIDMMSDVLSAIPQWRAKQSEKQATSDVKTIRKARAYDDSTSDEAVMARTASMMVKDRLKKKKK